MTQRRRVPVSQQSGGPESEPSPGPAESPADSEESCACPRLDPDDWDEVESDWSDIVFFKGHVSAILGVPIGFGKARTALEARAAVTGCTVPESAMLLLGPGRFRRRLLLEVEGVAAETRGVERPGGVAFTRLASAPMGEMRRVVAHTREIARGRYGRNPDRFYVWYLTCRICSAPRNYETLFVAHYRAKR